VEFDLRQSIDARGYKQPDEATFRAMQRAFEDWLWYEIEEHWADIVSYTGFDFAEDPSQERVHYPMATEAPATPSASAERACVKCSSSV
jgi:hypothetical protein